MGGRGAARSCGRAARLTLLVFLGRALAKQEKYDKVQTEGETLYIPDPASIPRDSVNYSWPWVHSYCKPCDTKVVGTCFTHACFHWRGPTECRMTKCMCSDGFCAIDGPSPGLEICAPQECVEGPRPLPFSPGRSLLFYQWLTDGLAFPRNISDHHDPKLVDWVRAAAWPNVIIVTFFTVLAVAIVWTYMAFARSPKREAERHEGEEESNPNDARPHGLALLTVIIVGLCIATALKRDSNWQDTMAEINELTSQAHANAVEIQRLGAQIWNTTDHLNQTMHAISDKCQGDPAMDFVAPIAINQTGDYIVMVEELNLMLKALPGMIKDGGDLINEYDYIGFWTPLLPVVLVATIIFVMQGSAVVAAWTDNLGIMFCLDRAMRVASLPYLILIILVAVFCLASMVVATLFSSFCLRVDDNILSMVKTFSESHNVTEVYELSSFYLQGTGRNNLAIRLTRLIKHDIEVASDMFSDFLETVLDAHAFTCPPVGDLSIDELVKQATDIIEKIQVLLQPANLYPFYDKIVRRSMCGEIVQSLANFPFFTLLISLIIFPTCVVLTHRYLVQYAKWRHDNLGDFVEDSASDDSDGDSEGASQRELVRK